MEEYIRIVKATRFKSEGEGSDEPGVEEEVRLEVYADDMLTLVFADDTGVSFDLEEFLQFIGEYKQYKIWDESRR